MSSKGKARDALKAASQALATGTSVQEGSGTEGGGDTTNTGSGEGDTTTTASGGDTTVASGATGASDGSGNAGGTEGSSAQAPGAAASAPTPAPAKPAKVKRDIFDVKTNEHLRKALWSTRGDIRMIVASEGKIMPVLVKKQSIIDLCEKDLQGKPLFLLERDRDASGQPSKSGATLHDPASIAKSEVKTDSNAGVAADTPAVATT